MEVDQELSDGLPESNPNKKALDRVMDKLPGVSSLEAVLLELDPAKAGPLGITDIRQQDAIRAEEFIHDWVMERVDGISGGVGLHHVVKQVRVVVNNNDESYFEMPSEDPLGRAEFDALWTIANNTVRSNIELTIRNPDYQSTVLVFQFEGPYDTDASKAIAGKLTEALGAYREAVASGDVPARYDIFKEQYVYNLGPQSGLHKFEGHIREELPIFAPAAFLVIFFSIMIGLRHPKSALMGVSTLLVAGVGTIGFLGWMKVPFTSANMSMIPLIIGNGIDYALHVLNEYTEERSKGKSMEETFKVVGGRAGVAMVLATTTSVAGILSLLFATSIALRQLSISASFALVMVTVLSLTFLPAAITLFGRNMKVQFKPSWFMRGTFQAVNNNKVVALVIFLAISGVFTWNTSNLSYFTDITSSNFPEDDQFVETYERLKVRQRGSADELVILEGDLTDPATLVYIRAIEEDLMKKEQFVKSRAHVNSLTVLLGAYELLGNTPSGAQNLLGTSVPIFLNDPTNVQSQVEEDDHVRNAAPTDRATIEADIAAMQANVAWRPLIDFLYSTDGTITIIDVLVDGDQGARDFSTLRAINEAILQSVEDNKHLKPDDVDVYVNGLSTGLYQYLDYSFYWLRVLFIVSAVVGTVMMYAFTRSFRATLAFLVPMMFTTTWFLGILPIFGILVGMSLVLPIIFITSIGSDYAAHLSWNILKTGHPAQVYETTGKAILFSAITDFGAFFIFSFSHLKGAVRDVALATSLAILAIFVVTMLVVPLFFNRDEPEEPLPSHKLDNL
ncbi:MAG: efflux RND transporter permease subunit [Thermoplasmatota archaeon]